MARMEQDREDLMREATALNPRIEWDVPGDVELVVTGWKASGDLSIYLGQDPVYQFDSDGRLRRAYESGFLYRTQGSTMARIHRERSARQTTLVRHDLNVAELDEFLTRMRRRLTRLQAALSSNQAQVRRHVGTASTEELAAQLARIAQQCVLAPAVTGRP